MPTLFEDWLRATQYRGGPTQAQQEVPQNWEYAPTAAAAPVADDQTGASILTRLMTTLQIPQQAITGAAAGAMDAEQERQSGHFNLADLLRPFSGAATGVGNALDVVLPGGGNPQDKLIHPKDLYEQYSSIKDRPQTQSMTAEQLREFVKNVRGPEYEEQLKHMGGRQKALRAFGDLAANFGTDPLTFAGGTIIKAPVAGVKALMGAKAVDEAIAGVDKVLPNVPAGLSEGQAAAAVDPASIKLGGTTVPVDTTGPSLINRINPVTKDSIPVPGSLTDRTLPGVTPASDTVEAAGRAAPEPLMEPAETAPGFIDDLADVPPGTIPNPETIPDPNIQELMSKLESNPERPAGAAALIDKQLADIRNPEAAAARDLAAQAAKRETVGADTYDASVAQSETRANELAHEKATDAATSAENLKIYEEAQTARAGQTEPRLPSTSSAHEDALSGYMDDINSGMAPEEAWAANGPEIMFYEHVAENIDSITERMNAARKSTGNYKVVTPEEVAARFSTAAAPVASKVERGAEVVAAQREAIPRADSVAEAESKISKEPADIYQALNAGAADALPKTTKGVQRAIDDAMSMVGKPLDEGGRISKPSPLDVVTNMALEKLGINLRNLKPGERALIGGGVKLKQGDTVFSLDLGMMARQLLSKGEFGKTLARQSRAAELTDKATGLKDTVRMFKPVDTHVLFEQPKLSAAQKAKEMIDPWRRMFEQKGEPIDVTSTSYRMGQAWQKALDVEAQEAKKALDIAEEIKGPLRDAEIAAQGLLGHVDSYENAVEIWEARLAQARKAKKSTAAAKAGLEKVNKFYAKTYGNLTREEAAKALETARANIVAAQERLKAQEAIAAKAGKIADNMPKKIEAQFQKELDKVYEGPAGPTRGLGELKDTEEFTLGSGSKKVTIGDIKDAIVQSAAEYNDVFNLTRKWERGESLEPGVKPAKPGNVTPDLPNDAAPPVTPQPYENVRDPIVQAENQTQLTELDYHHLPVHPDFTSESSIKRVEDRMKEILRLTDEDINTPYVRWGNQAHYQRVGPSLFRRLAKDMNVPARHFEDIYNGAGGGVAGAKALRAAGVEDVVVGAYTIEKQYALASRLKTTFHFGDKTQNPIARLVNRASKEKGKSVGVSKAGLENANRVAWDTLVDSEVSYAGRGARFITNYYPKDPQALSDMIRVAARDASIHLGRDVHPSNFMLYVTAKSARVFDDPEMIDFIKGFWESIPFISRNFDGARNAEKALQWGRLSRMFPTIAKGQRFVADEFGVPTKTYGFNSKVPTEMIMAEPGAAIGIQREMSQSAVNKAEAAAHEGEVASRAQEPVKDEHLDLDEASGGIIDPPDQGGNLNGSHGSGPNPGHGSHNSNSSIFSMLKQLWKNEMGHNELLNLIRDRNSYGKYVSTEIQNWWDHNMKMYTKAELGQTLIKYRHEAKVTTYTDREQEIINKYNEWVDHYFRGPQSVFVRSGLTEKELLEFMPHGGGTNELKQIWDPSNYLQPTKVRGEAAIHLWEDAPQVMSNMQQALTRALAMKHFQGDVLAKWTSPVADANRSKAIMLNGKKVYTTPEIAAQYSKSEHMLKEMLQYTPQGAKWVKELDGIQGIWKTMVTIARPGHHVRNSMGNSFMLIGGLQNSAHAGTYLKDAIGMLRDYGNYGAIIKSERFAGSAADKAEFAELLATGRVAPRSKNIAPKTLFEVKGQKITDQMVMSKIKEKGLFQGAEVSEDTERLASRTGGWNKKIMHAPYVRRMRQLSSLQEHAYRGAMFRGELEANMRKGMDFEKAADVAASKARRFYPDGLVLNNFEKNVLRRVIPFYTYNRTIMGPLLEVLMTKPHFAAAPLRVQQSIGETYGGDMPNVPDYLGAAYPTGPTYSIGDSQIGVDVGSQHLDAYKLLSDPKHQVASMVTPFGAIPIALMTGADITQSGTPLRTGEDYKNYLANNIPIFSSLFPTVTGHRVGGETDGDYAKQLAWINFLTGTKQKELNTPKVEKAWEFQQRDAS